MTSHRWVQPLRIDSEPGIEAVGYSQIIQHWNLWCQPLRSTSLGDFDKEIDAARHTWQPERFIGA